MSAGWSGRIDVVGPDGVALDVPRVARMVVDEPDPSMSIYAGQVAAPAFSDIARIALRRLDIPSTAGGQVTDVPELSDSAADVDDTPVPGTPSPREEEVGGSTGTTTPGDDDPAEDADEPTSGAGGEDDAADAGDEQ